MEEALETLLGKQKPSDRVFTSNIQLNRGSKYSAGYDICSSENVVIAPGRLVQVPTGLIINIPKGFVFVLKTKSRHTVNSGMMNMADGGYIPYSEIKKNYPPQKILEMMGTNRVLSDHVITVEGGVIDADYNEPIFVSVMNHSKTQDFVIKAGDQIAQGILLQHFTFDNDNHSKNERKGGFGSTN
jgi:dUTP pyrophosphatase